MLDNKKCVALSWDRDWNVFGIKVKKGKGGRLVVQSVARSGDEESFTERLSNVWRDLAPNEQYLVLMGGYLPGSVCFETRMPPMPPADLYDAIGYELPRAIPAPLEELTYGYRLVPGGEGGENVRVRVLVMRRSAFDDLIGDVVTAGLKADLILHPFMCVDPLLEDVPRIVFPSVDPDFAFALDSKERTRSVQASPASEDVEATAVHELIERLGVDPKGFEEELTDESRLCLLFAAYGTRMDVRNDRRDLLPLPKTLSPERFRGLRVLFILLLLTMVGLLVAFLGRLWWESRERLDRIEGETNRVRRAIDLLRVENRRKAKAEELMKTIYDADIGNEEIIVCLHRITKALPQGIWVKNFAARGFYVDMTLEALEGAKDDTSFLKRMRKFEVVNSHKRRAPNGKTNIYVRLRYLGPRGAKIDNSELN